MKDDEIELSDADAATVASIETPPKVQALWAAQGEAARAHDWPRFWQTRIDASAYRTEQFTRLQAPQFLQDQEILIRAKYIALRISTALGLWPEPGEDLPLGYIFDPACDCDVCQTLKSRKEQS